MALQVGGAIKIAQAVSTADGNLVIVDYSLLEILIFGTRRYDKRK